MTLMLIGYDAGGEWWKLRIVMQVMVKMMVKKGKKYTRIVLSGDYDMQVMVIMRVKGRRIQANNSVW